MGFRWHRNKVLRSFWSDLGKWIIIISVAHNKQIRSAINHDKDLTGPCLLPHFLELFCFLCHDWPAVREESGSAQECFDWSENLQTARRGIQAKPVFDQYKALEVAELSLVTRDKRQEEPDIRSEDQGPGAESSQSQSCCWSVRAQVWVCS